MILRVDPKSPVPPFEQIRVQIATMIQARVLPPGTRLPTIRQLAADLGLAGGTVARAYRELEASGAIITSGRRGTFVMQGASARGRGGRRLSEAASTFAREAAQLGVEPEEAMRAARAALQELTST